VCSFPGGLLGGAISGFKNTGIWRPVRSIQRTAGVVASRTEPDVALGHDAVDRGWAFATSTVSSVDDVGAVSIGHEGIEAAWKVWVVIVSDDLHGQVVH
jgi:hypothetical protein